MRRSLLWQRRLWPRRRLGCHRRLHAGRPDGPATTRRGKSAAGPNFAYYDNNIPLSQAYDDLLSFDDIPDHFNLAQQWFYLGQDRSTVRTGFDIGGRIDVIYGTDAQKTQAFGNPGAGVRGFGFYDASLDHGDYGWAIPQAYVEVADGDLSTKVGHFFTPIGYEVIPATGNFFYSHSLHDVQQRAVYPHRRPVDLLGHGEPDAVRRLDRWAGTPASTNSTAAATSSVVLRYTITDDVTFTYLNTYGNFGWRDGGSDNSYSHSMVLVADLTDKLQYIAQSDMLADRQLPASATSTRSA